MKRLLNWKKVENISKLRPEQGFEFDMPALTYEKKIVALWGFHPSVD